MRRLALTTRLGGAPPASLLGQAPGRRPVENHEPTDPPAAALNVTPLRGAAAGARVSVATLVLLTCAAPARAKIETPDHVKIVVRNNPRGIPSPDGTRFLYQRGNALAVARVSDAKVVQRIKVPKTRCGRGYCDGMGVIDYAWAPDGASIAYSVDTGNDDTGLYHHVLATKKATRVTDEEIWEFGFDSAGEVIYMTGVVRWGAGHDAAVWRAGESKPFLKLPDRGQTRVFELRRDVVVQTAKEKHARWHYDEITEVWLTDLATGAETQLAVPRGAGTVAFSPGDERACYFASSELHCIELASGDDTLIMGKRAHGWGTAAVPAWSPSGNRLAIWLADGGVAVHDFAAGTTKVVVENTTYKNFAFQTESDLLLLKASMPKHFGRHHENVGRVDVDTGERYAIVADETQYPYAFPIPGNADVTYVARDREGTTDLAWIDTSHPIGPVKTTKRPTTGTYTEWHANGNKKSQVTLRDGDLDGKARYWDWSGTPYERGRYDAGNKTGAWKTWFPSGKLESVLGYDGGKRHGKETWYWRDTGKVSKTAGWKRGAPHGDWRSYYPSGKRAMSGQHRDGKKVGTWTSWREDGTVLREETFPKPAATPPR